MMVTRLRLQMAKLTYGECLKVLEHLRQDIEDLWDDSQKNKQRRA